MANGDMVEVVYVGPKVFRQSSGSGESRKEVLRQPGDHFEVPSYTYASMKDVLKPTSVYDAEQAAKIATQEALEKVEIATKAASTTLEKPKKPEKPKKSRDEE